MFTNNVIKFSIKSVLSVVVLAFAAFASLNPVAAAGPADMSGSDLPEDSYIRFEVSKDLLEDFNGTLKVTHNSESRETSFNGESSTSVSAYVLFPEQMGPYTVSIRNNQNHDAFLEVQGVISQDVTGDYTHRLISGWADSSIFSLDPDSEGLKIDMGSVKGFLQSCLTLYSPRDFRIVVAVDHDGDGYLNDQLEQTSKGFQLANEGCVSSPEVPLPLTSMYESKAISMPDGTSENSIASSTEELIAYNEGVYDFLNKSGVRSDKDSDALIVKEFGVTFVRTPMASSVQILNSLIRPPETKISAVPQTREETSDILRQGDVPGQPEILAQDQTDSSNDLLQENLPSQNRESTAKWLTSYWPLLAGGLGMIVLIVLLIRNFAMAHRHKS